MRKELQHRILVLDGAMGTAIQDISEKTGKDFGKNNDVLPLTNPEVVSSIHRSYLEAGADIISTCSFGAQLISQEEFGLQNIREMNLAAARLARYEADKMTAQTPDKPRFVAGSVGPTGKMLSMSDNAEDPSARSISFDQLAAAYQEQMTGLIEGGVDALLIETIFDTLNAKAAIVAAQRAMEDVGRKVELMFSLTISDQSGRSLSGQTVEAFVISIAHAQPLSIGLNCGLGAEALLPYMRRLRNVVTELNSISDYKILTSCHPNAGLPNAFGKYEDTPELFCSQLQPFFQEGLLSIVGGCCGTTPGHIQLLADNLASASCQDHTSALDSTESETTAKSSLQSGVKNLTGALAGLEPFLPSSFTNIGERCNVAGSRKFLRLINEKNYNEALAIARTQIEKGAHVIDINMDDSLLDARQEMSHFVRLIASEPDIASVPLMLDSSRFEVIEESLKWVQGKCIVNSISLKEGEAVFLDHAKTIRQFGAAVIVMAFDEEGQAVTYERKIQICERAYRLLRDKLDFPATDIIFDPNILTVATGMAEHLDYGYDFVRATEWIHQNLPGARVSGGLSNLSFAFRGNNFVREAMHTVFLEDAKAKGMGMAILNPATALPVDRIPPALRLAIRSVLFTHRDEDSTELLIALAEEIRQKKEAEKAASAAGGVGKTVAAATLQADAAISKSSADNEKTSLPVRLSQALVRGGSPTLEEDLIEALKEYGSSLKIIEGPLMEGMNEVGRLFGEGKMFLPQVVKTARTMKQAVSILTAHDDISDQSGADPQNAKSKSPTILLATVKGDVHDIGKNIVGVVLTCNGYNVIDLGVMVQPETIIERAIADKADMVCLSGLITPSLEEMCTVARMMQEAGLCVPLVIGGATTSDLHTALRIAPLYENGVVVRASDAAQNPVIASKLLSPETRDDFAHQIKSQQNRLRGGESVAVKPYEGSRILPLITISEVRSLIDWRYFFRVWRVQPDQDEAQSLKRDAEKLLDELSQHDDFGMLALEAFFDARFTHDGVEVAVVAKGDEGAQPGGENGMIICDPEAPLCKNISHEFEPLGFFAVTISSAFIQYIEEQKKGIDDYTALLAQSLADRLAEATNQYLTKQLDRDFGWQGMRPAVGYPMWPKQSDIFRLAKLIDFGSIGITLTENGAMYPQASVAGAILTN